MDKTVKIGPTLSQILLSVIDKTAYLRGSTCAQILSAPQRLKPLIKKVTSATTRNSWIAKGSSGQAGISIRK